MRTRIHLIRRLAAGAVVVGVAACGSGAPNLGQLPADALYARGVERLEAGKWDEAIRALEQFIFQYPTHENYQEARFRLGKAYAGKNEHIMAAGEFSRLADDFPTSDWADDARFEVCREYHELSPIASRDQQYTVAAIQHCESLLAYYPDSEYAPQAREVIAALLDKLAEKVFRGGEFYFKSKAIDSAINVFEHVVETFPTSAWAPRALLRLHEAYVTIGYTEEAQQARERLLRDYPESEEARQLKGASAGSL
ncbi:MAG: outer membrane protein assembly factor BamD [Gemmatimonadetes bacterium]|nr:outer membrane protein assembly factor BamD [Gemmatimonadota bacterium]